MASSPAVLRSMIPKKESADGRATRDNTTWQEKYKGMSLEDGDEVIIIHTTENKLAAAERRVLDIQNLNDIPGSLRRLSTAASILQLFQSLVLFIIATRSTNMCAWYTSYPNPINPLEPLPNEIAKFSILWYAPAFTLLSGLEHMSCLLFESTYNYYIARNQNPFRWTEYTFSGSLVKVMIAQLVGVNDICLLIALFFLSAMCMQCAALHEGMNAKARADGMSKQSWRAWWVACTLWAVTWVVVFIYFNAVVQGGIESPQSWAIMFIYFFLDSSFAIVFALQWLRIGLFEDYVMGEIAFILLSFTSKTLLPWIVFGMR